MTVWEARKVGDRMLCGRQDAGEYRCTGEVGEVFLVPTIDDDGKLWPSHPRAKPPVGWYPAPDGIWRLTARASRKVAAGGRPVGRGGVIRKGDSRPMTPERWLACCPHCTEVNRVLREVLRY